MQVADRSIDQLHGSDRYIVCPDDISQVQPKYSRMIEKSPAIGRRSVQSEKFATFDWRVIDIVQDVVALIGSVYTDAEIAEHALAGKPVIGGKIEREWRGVARGHLATIGPILRHEVLSGGNVGRILSAAGDRLGQQFLESRHRFVLRDVLVGAGDADVPAAAGIEYHG